MEKTYTIRKSYKGRDSETTGTLKELHQYFGYTMEIGHSWEPKKVKLKCATIKSFVNNLQKAYSVKEACCYERTFVELV